MITLETLTGNAVKLTVPASLQAQDFQAMGQQVDALIQQHGTVRLLVDATRFNGWDSMKAFETHMGFVKARHRNVERVAVITGHQWQHWVIGVMRLFVHPEIKLFDRDDENKARQWITTA